MVHPAKEVKQITQIKKHDKNMKEPHTLTEDAAFIDLQPFSQTRSNRKYGTCVSAFFPLSQHEKSGHFMCEKLNTGQKKSSS